MSTALLAISLAALLHQEPPRKAREFPVKMEVVADKPAADRTQRIRVKLTIQEGYRLLANPTGIEDLNPTVLTVTVKDVKITYPPGEVVKDDVVGDYKVYRKQVTIEAVVKRTADESKPIEVKVTVRPFDDAGCHWLPRTLKATVP